MARLLQVLACLAGSFVLPLHAADDGPIVLRARSLELHVRLGATPNPYLLVDRSSGVRYADADYQYLVEYETSGGMRTVSRLRSLNHELQRRDDETTLKIEGVFEDAAHSLRLQQVFRVPKDGGFLEEEITLSNPGRLACRVKRISCGFRKGLYAVDREEWNPIMRDFQLVAIPFRVDPTGRKNHFSMWELHGGHPSHSRHLSEAWSWSDGKRGLVVSHYSQDLLRFSVMETSYSQQGVFLEFGGSGAERQAEEDGFLFELPPSGKMSLGAARYVALDGGWEEGYSEYKRWMDKRGHGLPVRYQPPLHWEPYYDFPWLHYTRGQMLDEARLAVQMGCELLYMDPRWEQVSGSGLWDADKLGAFDSFVDSVRDLGLRGIGLHIMGNLRPDEGQAAPQKLFPGSYRVDKEGKTHFAQPCFASAWRGEKTARLNKLTANPGVQFMMFDFHGWNGACWDRAHGHQVPLRRSEHAKGIDDVIRSLKRSHPDMTIEAHDPIVAGVASTFAPMYLGHDGSRSFDERWGFEYMHNPLADLMRGQAISLYYYNLAYDLPLYLHIPMYADNENAVMFWWYASTVRHLGIGGTRTSYAAPGRGGFHALPAERFRLYQRVVAEYKALRPFFIRGEFRGLHEMIHVHSLPDRNEAVLLLFNLTQKEQSERIEVTPARLGLSSIDSVVGAQLQSVDGRTVLVAAVQPMSMTLVKVNAKTR